MIKKMLVAYDGSPTAKTAFAFALDMAKKYEAHIQVLAVARIPDPPTEVEVGAQLEYAIEHYKHEFELMRGQAKEAGIVIETHVVSGHPAEQILHRAEQMHVDIIVMGHQTRSTLGRWIAGSVADRVVDHAQCTVIVVKHDRHASAR